MINILVVDDEPISADGISIYLEANGDSSWNVMTAYDGINAIKLGQQRIDVLLTDILMPGMDGFSLQEQLYQRWPMLKTVFLTGNRQLDYAQQAIRSGNAVDFVLKMEDESVALEAVRKAVAAIEDDSRVQDTLRKAEESLSKIKPLLQKDCLFSIIKGNMPKVSLVERFSQLDMPLRADMPVLLLVGQLSDHVPMDHMNDLAYCALENILERFIWPMYRFNLAMVSDRRILVMVQGSGTSGDMDIRHVFAVLDHVQQNFSKTMGSISLVLNNTTCAWEDVSQHYRALLLTLDQQAYVSDNALVIRSDMDELPEATDAIDLHMIRAYLDNRNYEQAYAICRNMISPKTPSGRITLYRQLLKLFSIAVDAREDAQEIYACRNMPQLQLDDSGWKQCQTDFAMLLRSLVGTGQTALQRKEELISKICDYVREHLAEDLSLSRIAEITYHSPTYISKLFVEVSGINYNHYVINKRLTCAADLLLSTRMLISDIVEHVGYRSASYFIHAFREKYGMTPAEYRKRLEQVT